MAPPISGVAAGLCPHVRALELRERVGQLVHEARADRLKFTLPIDLPELTISLLWHPRMRASAAHRWLRGPRCVRIGECSHFDATLDRIFAKTAIFTAQRISPF